MSAASELILIWHAPQAWRRQSSTPDLQCRRCTNSCLQPVPPNSPSARSTTGSFVIIACIAFAASGHGASCLLRDPSPGCYACRGSSANAGPPLSLMRHFRHCQRATTRAASSGRDQSQTRRTAGYPGFPKQPRQQKVPGRFCNDPFVLPFATRCNVFNNVDYCAHTSTSVQSVKFAEQMPAFPTKDCRAVVSCCFCPVFHLPSVNSATR